MSEQQRLSPMLTEVNRRTVLKYGLGTLLAAVVPVVSMRSAFALGRADSWVVTLHHRHTGESFSGIYRVGNRYLPEAFDRLNYVLRDFRTNQIFPMDPHTVDIISTLQRRAGGRPMEILSGYRCPKTNAMLREASAGVARNSLHMYGQAIDFRVRGLTTSRVRDMAKGLHAGGVGYYRRSDFVHVDSGAVRSW